jgi:hypothetical protein
VKEFAANAGLTGLDSNKVRRASLCHQAGGKPENIQFSLGTPGQRFQTA